MNKTLEQVKNMPAGEAIGYLEAAARSMENNARTFRMQSQNGETSALRALYRKCAIACDTEAADFELEARKLGNRLVLFTSIAFFNHRVYKASFNIPADQLDFWVASYYACKTGYTGNTGSGSSLIVLKADAKRPADRITFDPDMCERPNFPLSLQDSGIGLGDPADFQEFGYCVACGNTLVRPLAEIAAVTMRSKS